MVLICYPKCSTCKKAQAWLDANLIPYIYRDIKVENPTEEELTGWYQQSNLPLRRLFNTSGMLYRSMELAQKLPEMSEAQQLQLLSSDGLLVKRPLLIGADFVLVGFKEAEWAKRLLE
jgi:arsenate reductase